MILMYLDTIVMAIVAIAALMAGNRKGRNCGYFSPAMFLLIAYCAYCVGLPISRLFFGSIAVDTDAPFAWMSIVGGICLAAGAASAGSIVEYSSCAVVPVKLNRGWIAKMWPLIVGGVVTGVKMRELGWDLGNILSPYGSEAAAVESAGLLKPVHVIASHVLIASIVYRSALCRLSKRPATLVWAAAAVASAFFLLRGSRNSFLMIALPVVVIQLRQRLTPRTVALSACLAYFGFYSLAVARNVGYEDLATVRESIGQASGYLDPLAGELGTQVSVFEKWSSVPRESLELGATYTIDAVATMVPSAIWPGRPPTPAQRFSQDYFATNELTEGLGFSPMVEAMQNFGPLGIVVVFFAFAFLLTSIEARLSKVSPLGLAAYALLFPAAVNWNRIDFATNLKMYVLFLPVLVVAHRLSVSIRKSAATPAVRRRLVKAAVP